ncbi:MAG: TIGR02677 family protein [Frankiaceae bacterium]
MTAEDDAPRQPGAIQAPAAGDAPRPGAHACEQVQATGAGSHTPGEPTTDHHKEHHSHDSHHQGYGTLDEPGPAFGIDSFTADDRLRLLFFAAQPNRHEYLWTLRAFNRARARYQVLLSVNDVAAEVAALAAEFPDCPPELNVAALCDRLTEYGNLDRTHDGAKAATIAEYRRRHAVFQLTEAGYVAYRAVEQVIDARLTQVGLSRLVFPDILADLVTLAEANQRGDSEEVFRKLSRLDSVLADITQRAARFYLMLGDLARGNDSDPETFLQHKDALLAHMRDFQVELQRYTPRLRDAVHRVERTGVDRLVERAAEADDRPLLTAVERLEDWRARWAGLQRWFGAGTAGDAGGGPGDSDAERLEAATITAISDVLALLRRVTESRRGGVSRESQLRHLATWFARLPNDRSAHALFGAAFNWRSARHLAVGHDAAAPIPARRSWWDAPPVEYSGTLLEQGRARQPGRPAPLARNGAAADRLRAAQLARRARLAAASESLTAGGVHGRCLDEDETALLLVLLDKALAARTVVTGRTTGSGSAAGSRLTLVPCAEGSLVVSVRGTLALRGLRLVVEPAGRPAASVLAAAVPV